MLFDVCLSLSVCVYAVCLYLFICIPSLWTLVVWYKINGWMDKYSYLLNYFWTTVTLFTYVVKISLLLCMSFVSLMFQRLLAIAFVFHIAFISGTTDMRDKEIGAPTSRYTELWTNFKMACSLLWPRMSLTSDLERVTISQRYKRLSCVTYL